MATFTTNYNLRKPAGSDFVTVATDINDNMDDIDTEIKALDTRLDAIESYWEIAGGSGTQTITSTTLVDITGVTVNVTVGSTSDVFKVTLVVDIQNNTADSEIGFATINVNGADQTRELVWQPGGPGSDECRATLCGVWVVTGIAAGTRTFKARGRVSGGAGFDFRPAMGTLLVERIR